MFVNIINAELITVWESSDNRKNARMGKQNQGVFIQKVSKLVWNMAKALFYNPESFIDVLCRLNSWSKKGSDLV